MLKSFKEYSPEYGQELIVTDSGPENKWKAIRTYSGIWEVREVFLNLPGFGQTRLGIFKTGVKIDESEKYWDYAY